MKTLFKTYTSHHKAIEKRKQFEAKTGVKWNFHSTGDGIRFTPIVTIETPINDNLSKKLLPHLITDYQGFVYLSKISKMSLSDVLIAAQTLVKNQHAICGVNRMGNFATIRAKTTYETIIEQPTKTAKTVKFSYSK